MNTKTSVRDVIFRQPFLLPGMERAHPPGHFEVQVVEEPLDVMWEAYHRVLTIMLTSGGVTEAVPVTEVALEQALAADSEGLQRTAPIHQAPAEGEAPPSAVPDMQTMTNLQQFSASSNGDRWYLGTDEATRQAFVLHKANQASGGHETKTLVVEFLNQVPFGPERDALIEMLGVGDDASDAFQDSYTSSSL